MFVFELGGLNGSPLKIEHSTSGFVDSTSNIIVFNASTAAASKDGRCDISSDKGRSSPNLIHIITKSFLLSMSELMFKPSSQPYNYETKGKSTAYYFENVINQASSRSRTIIKMLCRKRPESRVLY
jgi:hypothetical protein